MGWMLPIHLAIGLVEGFVTAAVAGFIRQARPEVIALAEARPVGRFPLRGVMAGVAVAALLTAGVLSWFASAHPDGLEWALERATGKTELAAPAAAPVYVALASAQQRTELFPDYELPRPAVVESALSPAHAPATPACLGLSLAGVAGSGLTLALVALGGVLLRPRRSSANP
jgi:cobalt/nickel transport system permease protein